MRGLLGTGPPDPTLESASPSPSQGSIWHRIDIDSTLIRHRFPVLILLRCQTDPWGGESEADSSVGSGGPEPNKPLTTLEHMGCYWQTRDMGAHHRKCHSGPDYVIMFGPWYGGVQNVWVEENVLENVLSPKFLDPSKLRASGLLCRGFLYRQNRALTPERGGKRTARGGVQNPFLGAPLFFHPSMASSDMWVLPNWGVSAVFNRNGGQKSSRTSTRSWVFWDPAIKVSQIRAD